MAKLGIAKSTVWLFVKQGGSQNQSSSLQKLLSGEKQT